MFSIPHIIAGLVMVAAGVCFVKFTFRLVNITGNQQWLEKYTGSGSTYGMYKLFGVVLVIIGILFISGFYNNIMDFLFAPLRNVFQPFKNG